MTKASSNASGATAPGGGADGASTIGTPARILLRRRESVSADGLGMAGTTAKLSGNPYRIAKMRQEAASVADSAARMVSYTPTVQPVEARQTS